MAFAPGDQPLIVTLDLDLDAFTYFDDLRRAHFPVDRNVLRAHLTLFHALPGNEVSSVMATLLDAANRRGAIGMLAAGVRFLGRGVAIEIESDELCQLRGLLAAEWSAWLSNQDRQGFRPHVTVQNKVEPGVARALADQLRAGFAPFPVMGTGLALWRYVGGPWQPAQRFPFRDAQR